MITNMRKYAFMVYHKEYDSFLLRLRDLGVLHVQEIRPSQDDNNLQLILSQRKRLNEVLRTLKKLRGKEENVELAPARELDKEEGLALLAEIEGLQEKKTQLQTTLASLEREIDFMNIWGDFSYEDIEKLRESGYKITFFNTPSSKFDPEWIDRYNAIEINNLQSVSYFITVTKVGEPVDIDAERSKMPDSGLSCLKANAAQVQRSIKDTDKELEERAVVDYNTLVELDKNLENEFNIANVRTQTNVEAGDKLMMLEGWVPEDSIQTLEADLEKEGFYYQEMPVEEGDKVPIKLRNNNFTKLFEPITKMFALPKYSEFDPTPFFAPFFMLFFGLCFGDGGYGFLLFLAGIFIKRKVSPEYKPYVTLFQYFGLSALFVGTLTGSFFGLSLIEIPAFEAVKDYFLTTDHLMTIAIVIGLVQIIFGKLVAAFQTKAQKGLKHSISAFAWVFVLVALIIAFGLPVLGIELHSTLVTVLYVIAGISFLVTLFYNAPGKNIFMNFGGGLWNTYNMASGLLGDTLSYIRLFAIGLTGTILGGVFNSLAVDMTDGMHIVPRAITMLLILAFGHSLNFALCTISSLVHPLRLTFVEYYKNAEFEGGGKEYRPFRKA
ncbi:MAG: ATPase [Tannerellaceae bacterium]|nr:ATPase [Tannerellaceae bacterium]